MNKNLAGVCLFCIVAVFTLLTYSEKTADAQLTLAGNAPSVSEKFKLAAPISDHMVLQQGKETSVWGTGKIGSEVTVAFGEQEIVTTTNEDGRWKATLAPSETSAKPAKMTVTSESGEVLTINDILVGEVWMCSGQSNMAWTLKRTKDPAVKDANHPLIRIFKTNSKTAVAPMHDCGGKWQITTPETAAEFSAVAYHFGRELNANLDVPIGLVDTSWGGKPVEAFTSYEKLKTVEMAKPLLEEWDSIAASYDPVAAKVKFDAAMFQFKKRKASLANVKNPETKPASVRPPRMMTDPKLNSAFPASIYNQKVAPWTNYAIAGSIWYQGESNRNRAVQYESLLTALIEDWREKWGGEDFPFYIVQLANFQKPSTQPGVPDSWAELQNAQTQVANTLPNCGIAIINDIGAANDIHPKNKRDVGYRLSLLALKQHYGKELPEWSSPLYKSHQIADDHILVTMDHVGGGLKSKDNGALKRFEVAGEDKKWHWANATIESKNTIKVSSESVPNPVAVRYAWASNPAGANLVNSAGLPASLFRTDDWPLSTVNNLTRRNPADTARQMKRQGFTALFNGKDLKGWKNPYEHGNAKVVKNEIHLTANKKFFLVTEKQFSDFELLVDIKLPEGKANSGVMFRCHVEPNRVYGYQAECDGSDRRWSAGLYDEGRRGWIWPSKQGRSEDKFLEYEAESQAHFAKPNVRGALKRKGWNRYKVTCKGDKIKIELNGVSVTELTDETDAKGFIGIQHHGEKGQTYRFRNLYIKALQ